MDKRIAPDAPDQVDIGSMNQSIGFLLRMAQLHVYEHFFDELGDHDIRPGEHSVLVLIQRNPGIRQGVLAQRLRIKRAHMTKLVRAMEMQGLVARSIPDSDRRAVELRLTGEGEKIVARNVELVQQNDETLTSRLSNEQTLELHRLLQIFTGLDAQ